jgi:hypothetical protein
MQTEEKEKITSQALREKSGKKTKKEAGDLI